MALPGAMTYLRGFFTYSFRGASCRSWSSTRLWEWATRVQVRNSTGVSYASDSSKASFMKSRHSPESAGSTMGTLDAIAWCRESCSFWEECMPGSSATAMTKPPLTPV